MFVFLILCFAKFSLNFAKFSAIQINFVKISCFGKFVQCCFAATLCRSGGGGWGRCWRLAPCAPSELTQIVLYRLPFILFSILSSLILWYLYTWTLEEPPKWWGQTAWTGSWPPALYSFKGNVSRDSQSLIFYVSNPLQADLYLRSVSGSIKKIMVNNIVTHFIFTTTRRFF